MSDDDLNPRERFEKAQEFSELANRRLYRPRGFDRLEYLPQLRGRKASETYREMATGDALIGAILFAIEMVLRRVEWKVDPYRPDAGAPSSDDLERADFLNSCMGDMSHSWEEFLSNALTMLPFGFAFCEIVYKRRDSQNPLAPAAHRSRFADGRIGWRKFTLVPHATIDEWDLDDYGGVKGAWQGGVYGEQRVRIPIEKAVLFRTNTRSPQGTSVLRPIVQSWYYRKKLQEIEGIGAERDLAGLPIITVDVDSLSKQGSDYRQIVRNLRRDEQEGIVFPGVANPDTGKLEPMADLELLSSSGRRQFDVGSIIQRHSREIAISLLQDVVLLGHERVGTEALASEKRDLSDTALQAWLNDIAAVMNSHAVPRLFALNGESLDNLPMLKPGEIRPTDVKEFATAVKDMASGGWVFAGDPAVEAIVRHRLGFPEAPPDGGVADEYQEDRETAQEQADNFMQNGDNPDGQPAGVTEDST